MAPGDRSRILHRYLLDDELVVVATRHHWAKLLEPVATTVAAFLLLAWVSGPLERLVGEAALLVWWLWLGVLARLLWQALEWRNEWFVATDRRLLMTYGLITHKVAMMPLRKVTDMNYARSPVGRVLGYGQFLLESAGQDQAMREISWLPDPDRAYRRICDTIFGPGVRDPDDALHEEPEPAAAPRRAGPGSTGPRWEVADRDEPGPAEPSSAGASRYQPPDVGWEVSTEDADQYVPVRVARRGRRRRTGHGDPVAPAAGRTRSGFDPGDDPVDAPHVEAGSGTAGWVDDPDATGPIPRPGGLHPGR